MHKVNQVKKESHQILEEWLAFCTRGGKISRNTVSIGVVVLDHLCQSCPVSREEVISPGGEVKGARSGLGNILEKYGISRKYLKEVTTRQGHQDGQRLFEAFTWGEKLMDISLEARYSLLHELIKTLSDLASQWLMRQNLKLDIDRRQAPTAWINLIIENAKQRSGGVLEQHKVGLNPILLVPNAQEYKATALAQDEGIDKELSIISIEAFVAINIIELAAEESKDFFGVLQDIIQVYNRRLSEVETDLSLRIEVR